MQPDGVPCVRAVCLFVRARTSTDILITVLHIVSLFEGEHYLKDVSYFNNNNNGDNGGETIQYDMITYITVTGKLSVALPMPSHCRKWELLIVLSFSFTFFFWPPADAAPWLFSSGVKIDCFHSPPNLRNLLVCETMEGLLLCQL